MSIRKFHTGQVAKGTVIFSDESVDAHKDIVRQGGWDLSRFYGDDGEERNPVMLYGHDRDGFPIGKWSNVRVIGDKLVGEPVFADKENPQAEIAKKLYDGGFLKSVSVSFRPIEWKDMDNGGREYLKQELLEVSFVSVPANPNALARAISKGVITDEDVAVLKGISDEELPGDDKEEEKAVPLEDLIPRAEDILAKVDEYITRLDALAALSEEFRQRLDSIEEERRRETPAPEVVLNLDEDNPQGSITVNREDVADAVKEYVSAEVWSVFRQRVNYILGKVED